jgi:hypothetical protein
MTLDEMLLGSPMTKQDVADAMLLAPSGEAAAGSVAGKLASIDAKTSRMRLNADDELLADVSRIGGSPFPVASLVINAAVLEDLRKTRNSLTASGCEDGQFNTTLAAVGRYNGRVFYSDRSGVQLLYLGLSGTGWILWLNGDGSGDFYSTASNSPVGTFTGNGQYAGHVGPTIAGTESELGETVQDLLPDHQLAVGSDGAVTVGVNNDKSGYSIEGASGGVGPTAGETTEDIYGTAFKNGTVSLYARVYKDGVDIHQADVATITYSVYLLDGDDADARTAVVGHQAVALDAADVLFDTLQSDAQASNYNFKHTIPIGEHAAFAIAGRSYLAEYVITPNVGERIIVRFRIEVK